MAEDAAAVTGFDLVSVQEQAVVLYPNGYNRWHTGFGDTDDVLFIRTLIDRLEADYQIDPARLYAMGFANGAETRSRPDL